MKAPSVKILNETSLIIYFSDEVDASLPMQIADCVHFLQAAFPAGVVDFVDFVASFTSLLLVMDTRQQTIVELRVLIANAVADRQRNGLTPGVSRAAADAEALVTIPVYYGEEVALDAAEIAAHAGKDFTACVDVHSQTSYQVYAVGFTLGFAYLGMLDPALCMPRKATPRLRVPAGSVAIADRQTAVYPRVTPGGWHIIGRTSFDFGDISNGTLPPLRVGDRVAFRQIDREEFLAGGGDIS